MTPPSLWSTPLTKGFPRYRVAWHHPHCPAPRSGTQRSSGFRSWQEAEQVELERLQLQIWPEPAERPRAATSEPPTPRRPRDRRSGEHVPRPSPAARATPSRQPEAAAPAHRSPPREMKRRRPRRHLPRRPDGFAQGRLRRRRGDWEEKGEARRTRVSPPGSPPKRRREGETTRGRARVDAC